MSENKMTGELIVNVLELLQKQEPLPPEMAKVLYDNLWELYESDRITTTPSDLANQIAWLKKRIDGGESFHHLDMVHNVLPIIRNLEALAQQQENWLNEIADIFGIGSGARSFSTIKVNVSNSARRSDCLSEIENQFFSVMKIDEDGFEYEACDLNWGVDRNEYIEQFRKVYESALNAAVSEALEKEAERWEPSIKEEILVSAAKYRALKPLYTTEHKASNEQDAKDAARYRYLRASCLESIGAGGIFAGIATAIDGDDWDASIDAALSHPSAKGE